MQRRTVATFGPLGDEHAAVGAGNGVRVARNRHRQRDDATGDAVEVDAYFDGIGIILSVLVARVVCSVFVLLALGLALAGLLGTVAVVLVVWLVVALVVGLIALDGLLVAFVGERRRVVGAQHGGVHAVARIGTDTAGVGPARPERHVCARQEVQMLAVAAPRRRVRVCHRIGQRVRGSVGQRPDHDPPQHVGERLRVGEPFRVGRPAQAHAAALHVDAADVRRRDRAACQLDDLHAHVVVDERDALAVG